MKQLNYTQFLKAEYKRLKRAKPASTMAHLRDMDELLKKIETMPSPIKEVAFVEGILKLNHIPSIAA